MATIRLSPEQQIKNAQDVLYQTEARLEENGVNIYLLRTWLDQTLHLRDMLQQQTDGSLGTVEIDPEDYY